MTARLTCPKNASVVCPLSKLERCVSNVPVECSLLRLLDVSGEPIGEAVRCLEEAYLTAAQPRGLIAPAIYSLREQAARQLPEPKMPGIMGRLLRPTWRRKAAYCWPARAPSLHDRERILQGGSSWAPPASLGGAPMLRLAVERLDVRRLQGIATVSCAASMS